MPISKLDLENTNSLWICTNSSASLVTLITKGTISLLPFKVSSASYFNSFSLSYENFLVSITARGNFLVSKNILLKSKSLYFI